MLILFLAYSLLGEQVATEASCTSSARPEEQKNRESQDKRLSTTRSCLLGIRDECSRDGVVVQTPNLVGEWLLEFF
jgi:hypothetical protein